MGFDKTAPTPVDKKVTVIKREVQVPKFVDVEVKQAVIVEEKFTVKVPEFVPYEVKGPVITKEPITVKDVTIKEEEYTVRIPKFVEYEVKVPVFVPYEVKEPQFVKEEVTIQEVKVIPKVVTKEITEERVNWVDVDKDHVVDRPIFKDVHVDVIKPHYKCQNCGQEV